MMNVTSWSAEPFIFIDTFRSQAPSENTCSPENGNLGASVLTRTGYPIGACIPLVTVVDSSTGSVGRGRMGQVHVRNTDDMRGQHVLPELHVRVGATTNDDVCSSGMISTCIDSDDAYQKSPELPDAARAGARYASSVCRRRCREIRCSRDCGGALSVVQFLRWAWW
ncbi:hypothetical protein M427DRAFT_341412 [Gonapodya prolifera JEL478]|uniref:Uncharacterized protein n=1 Tax=Gonapodya prolifera (strain JEL478) TaxID=1344416 RepID=A0A139ACD8_GONPJ|nr:hypothetical protein M427DRAFT_341412 [Gonapodya prolifera JEL478]|eukprot:KXS14408.1 hypothetical protein M427DRAFT_341412 [Gonapodya prolifera JEL478]